MKNLVTIVYISLKVDVAQRVGRVGFGLGQTGYRSKTGHFKRVKNGFGSFGFWVRLTCIFHMIFLKRKLMGKAKYSSSLHSRPWNVSSSMACRP